MGVQAWDLALILGLSCSPPCMQVREHLALYAALKGVPHHEAEAEIEADLPVALHRSHGHFCKPSPRLQYAHSPTCCAES